MKQKNEHNIYLFLLLRFLATLAALLLAQVVFALSNRLLFSVDSFAEWMGILWGNIRFGVATVALALLPYWLMMLLPVKGRFGGPYRVLAETIYWVMTAFVLAATLTDAAYYSFTYRRLSSEIFQYLTIGGNMGTLGPKFLLGYWYDVLAGLALFLFLLFTCRRNNLARPKRKNDKGGWLPFVVGMFLVALATVGGFQPRLLMERSISNRYCQVQNTPLVTNSAYNIFYTALYPSFVDYQFEDFDSKAFSPVVHASATQCRPQSHPMWAVGGGRMLVSDSTNSGDTIRYSNVVVILLESFSQEFMGCYNKNGESYTPFLDSLARHSHLYNGRSNGKKSIESIPAVMAGVPTLMECPLLTSRYLYNDYTSLPSILKRYSYSTAFFHGSYNGVMCFDTFCYNIGFDRYVGKDQYDERFGEDVDFDGAWGVFDEPWLKFMLDEINQMPEPFFVGEFTLSSHHPYTVPDPYKGRLKKGPKPLLQVVNYSDRALQNFFAAASKQPWFERTLFIIMGDHPGCVLTRDYTGLDGSYCIPMMFYLPGEQARGTHSNTIVQQTDILPTIVDYLGLDETTVCFGNSLFQPHEGWQIVYGNGYYILNRGDRTATLMCSNTSHPRERHITGRPDDVRLLLSIVEQYNQRMNSNQLTVK